MCFTYILILKCNYICYNKLIYLINSFIYFHKLLFVQLLLLHLSNINVYFTTNNIDLKLIIMLSKINYN